MPELAEQEAREELLLGLRRGTEQTPERLLAARRGALARDRAQRVEAARGSGKRQRRRERRRAIRRAERCRPEADLPAQQNAGQPGNSRLALVGCERPQALREQADLLGAAARRGHGHRHCRKLMEHHAGCASTAIGSVANSSRGSSAAPCAVRPVKTSTAPAASRGRRIDVPRQSPLRSRARESAARPSARYAARDAARTRRSRRRAAP